MTANEAMTARICNEIF